MKDSALDYFSLLLISYRIDFLFFKVDPKYLNSSTLTKQVLSVFIPSLHSASFLKALPLN
jgi:hypothetical protein